MNDKTQLHRCNECPHGMFDNFDLETFYCAQFDLCLRIDEEDRVRLEANDQLLTCDTENWEY